MKQNTATWDRILRGVGGIGMLTCAVLAPLPLLARVLALGAGGIYLLASALLGSCLGYRMMGISTCAVAPKRHVSD